MSKEKLLSLLQLRVYHASLADGKFTIGFYDPSSQTFYKWRDIVLQQDQLPKYGPTRHPLILDATKLQIVVVDAPLSYLKKTYAEYIPGHLNANMGIFYQWKGTIVWQDDIPWDYIGPDGRVSALYGDEFHTVIEIEPPKFMMQQPERWKKAGDDKNDA